ncbi:MAG: hypothetical protein NZ988_06505 [Thaumarchaeota archaeon]|nr:hypothetical protein [Candidatus Calditenuaceae archaeon]MDW8187670.1 hypothetical protein [Nitrososphaerota archaeon]
MGAVEPSPGRQAQGKRMDQILREINDLKGPIEKTLMDVREILSTLDNPLRTLQTVDEPKTRAETRQEAPEKEGNQRPQPKRVHLPTTGTHEGFDTLTFNVFACTELLTKLLGRWQLERLLLGMEGEDVEEVRNQVRRALEALSAVEPLPDQPILGIPMKDALHLGLVLLNLLLRDPRNPVIGVVVLLLDRIISPLSVKR